MVRLHRSLIFVLTFAAAILTHCKERLESDVKGEQEKICPDWTDGTSNSVLGDSVPYKKMPGVVVGVKLDSWGRYDTATVNSVRDKFMDVFFDRAQKLADARGDSTDLFYTVIALDAREVTGLAGLAFPGEAVRQTKAQMADAYRKVPAALKSRFSPSSRELEKYVLVVNDSSMEIHNGAQLPNFGGFIFTKGLCKGDRYDLPRDQAKIVQGLRNALHAM